MARWFSIGPAISLRGRKFKGLRGFAGKPFHPPLTDLVVGAYFFFGIFDLVSYLSDDQRTEYEFFRAGTILLISGFLFSLPTMLTGFWDWLKSTPPRTQAWRTANWHMAVMLVTSLIVALDIFLRLGSWHAGHADVTITILSVLAGGLVAYGAAYGGGLVFEYAFNVEQDFDHAYTESERDYLPGQAKAEQEAQGG